MSVMLTNLRASDPVAYAELITRAKENAKAQKVFSGNGKPIDVKQEWNRADQAGQDELTEEQTWDLALLAMVATSQDHQQPRLSI